ncbi:MAG: 3-deoxy-D-manno-octulosonic acid transferase [Rhodospirillales bacterium]
MMLRLYRLATALGAPLIFLYLFRRKARGKEDRRRFGERLGRSGRARPAGPLVWAHAASIGESLSMLPLIERLRGERPAVNVLVTTGTVTSAGLLAERLPDGAFHQYVPVDRLRFVRRFFDHWRPDLVLWAESEFWPNLVSEPAARGIPMVLINGRVSPRSFAGWQRWQRLIAGLLSGFALCLGQTEADAERLRRLGAPRAKCLGNLKFAVAPLPADERELAGLAEIFGDRPRWLAASTHAGEEDIAGRVHRRLKVNFPALLTIVVPRHPRRGQEIAAALRKTGLTVALRSAGDVPTPDTDIYVADTLGELGLFYRLCGIVFMGKSLVPLGGQNPLEAARLDCALIHGPHMANFEEMAHRLRQAGASEEVADEAALALSVERLLADDKERARRAAAAKTAAAAEAGVIDAVMMELAPFIESLSGEKPHAGA